MHNLDLTVQVQSYNTYQRSGKCDVQEEFKKSYFYIALYKSCFPWVVASFDPRRMVQPNFVKDHYIMVRIEYLIPDI